MEYVIFCFISTVLVLLIWICLMMIVRLNRLFCTRENDKAPRRTDAALRERGADMESEAQRLARLEAENIENYGSGAQQEVK